MVQFVLVWHSAGANTVRLFATAYPEEVAGLVLIEPPLFAEVKPILLSGLRFMRQGLKILSRRGVILLLGERSMINLLFGGASPPPALPEQAGFLYRPAAIQTPITEIEALPETIWALNNSNIPGAWRDWPVVIISAKKEKEPPIKVRQELDTLVGLPTNGRVYWIESSHFVHSDHPELVVKTIRQFSANVRR